MMTDAERLDLAKRMHASEAMTLVRYKAKLEHEVDLDVSTALANMVDITRAKLSTMRALFPELMEATQ